MRALIVIAAALIGAGCAHLKNDKTVCPEYRSVVCATAPECSMDQARGCRVCQCSPAIGAPGTRPDAVQPDLRH